MYTRSAINRLLRLPDPAVLIPQLDLLQDFHADLFEGAVKTAGLLKKSRNCAPVEGGRFVWFCKPGEVKKEYAKLFAETQQLAGPARKLAAEARTRTGAAAAAAQKSPAFLASEGDPGEVASIITRTSFVAQFHARLIYIHPFDDGNGRLARFIAWEQIRILFPEIPFEKNESLDRAGRRSGPAPRQEAGGAPGPGGAAEEIIPSKDDRLARDFYLRAIRAAPDSILDLVRYFSPVELPSSAWFQPIPRLNYIPKTVSASPPP